MTPKPHNVADAPARTEDDIRWHRGADDGERLTYIESLKAELNHRNPWIDPGEWAAIEKWLPTITEEAAKEQCHIIHDKIKARVDWYRHTFE